ncbi:sulfotransferase domain-containing protein [Sphingomonas sp. R647]|uniref:sulfotransferase domain-containing protein n=1 Tax=Sphingomonas sp. R647 TaxID=2875233 RepID=UPI001CD357CB|nr:sulfotransferase domain-containing protein [Sphingomonas sp. R647]MCA1198850.1 sulfotransferase domain-containing protein [Sphingomonas sp. R647]
MSGIYWLASYPKSGNTWLRLLLRSYAAGGAAVDINAAAPKGWSINARAVFDEAIGVAASDLTDREILAWWPSVLRQWALGRRDPAYLKTHMIAWPFDLSLGAVYLVRDPRDVALSLARHADRSIDAAITMMGTRDKIMDRSRDQLPSRLPQLWGSWSQNVESWLGALPFPVHVQSYEALRADPAAALTELLPVLGFQVDRAAIDAAVAATALETLRAQEAARGFVEAEGPNRFFGEGRVGGWRDRLTPAQCARIKADHGPAMARLGYLDPDY